MPIYTLHNVTCEYNVVQTKSKYSFQNQIQHYYA